MNKQYRTIIVGGTRGLGHVLARNLYAEGHQLILLARHKPELSAQIQNATYIEVDLLDEISLNQALTNICQTQNNINNLIFVQRYRGKNNTWQGDLDISLTVTHQIINALTQKNKLLTKNASIVLVSSIVGTFMDDSQPLSYAIAKAGIHQLVKYYAVNLGKEGIRVNSVSPIAYVKDETREFYEKKENIRKLYEKIVPLGRMCEADDVANTIAFLCSTKAAFISGQNLIVDGGLSVIGQETLAKMLMEIGW